MFFLFSFFGRVRLFFLVSRIRNLSLEVELPAFYNIDGRFQIDSNWNIFGAKVVLYVSDSAGKMVRETSAPTFLCKSIFDQAEDHSQNLPKSLRPRVADGGA